MAVKDFIESVELTTNTNNIGNRSITGRSFVAEIGVPYFGFKVTTVPMTRSDFHTNFLDFFTTESTAKVSANLLPILGDTTNQIAFGDSVVRAYSTATVGANQLNVIGEVLGDPDAEDGDGAPINYVSGQLKAGDLIAFSDQTKLYMVTADVSVSALSGTAVTIFPPLLKAVSTSPTTLVNTIDVNAQVIATGDVTEFVTDIDGYYVFEQTFREVL